MSQKIKTIKLERSTDLDKSEMHKRVNKYKVLQITDSLDFEPQAFITAEQVAELCAAKDWKVTIV